MATVDTLIAKLKGLEVKVIDRIDKIMRTDEVSQLNRDQMGKEGLKPDGSIIQSAYSPG